MVKVTENIVYAPATGERGHADLFIPDNAHPGLAALVIHGGGWSSLDKSSLHPLAALFAAQGIAALCPNYRLLNEAPWPACGDDCLMAARFALDRMAEFTGGSAGGGSLIVAGASAGGHLALMTGLRLPPGKVRAIVSIAGPSDMHDILADPAGLGRLTPRTFFGDDRIEPERWRDASPLAFIRPGAPELFCIHSRRDTLVPPSHSEKVRDAARRAGVRCEVLWFEGRDGTHGCWMPTAPGTPRSERRFVPEVEGALRDRIEYWKR